MTLYAQVWQRYGDVTVFLCSVRERMAQHGISKTQLANRFGTHPSHVCNWLNVRPNGDPRVTPDLKTLLQLDEALDQLVSDKDGK